MKPPKKPSTPPSARRDGPFRTAPAARQDDGEPSVGDTARRTDSGAARNAARPETTQTGPSAITHGARIEGRYRISVELGSGKLTRAFLARDELRERDVVVKVARSSLNQNESARQQFMQTARAMATLHHPHVVTIHAVGELSGTPYMVVEPMLGGDLERWLTTHDEPSVDEALAMLEQIAGGVDAIHAARLIHGDLKTGNVLLGSGFRLAVADFGLLQPDDTNASVDDARPLVGTPEYMAPELVLGEVDPGLEPRVDIYSLGVIAFRLLAHSLPFQGTTMMEVLARRLTSSPPLLSKAVPLLGAEFDEPLLRALATNPSVRPKTAAELVAGLLAARARLRVP